ncbi:DeoR family transcriptional regulator [Alkalihalobacillus oceani]|uniref:DeoR family transcriptional regulator n=1 Tax=Halalkalibacter oceani TaxID=1653776 RepID=A0A9X2IM89_9BACI|nr:DeoR family transcriptional regulator [Halalkalibacter oceani]MCM3712491.1 DeoR family transcriptional regulator [Halalkalibacter oceani]
MNKTKKTTKDKILEALKIDVSLTVNDLTERLKITHMAVRKHLSTLEQDQLIQAKEVKQPMGRPLQVFSLTAEGERLFPKNYEGISVEFLQDIQDLHGKETIDHLFQKREQRLAAEYKARVEHKRPTERIYELARIQNEKGYMTDVHQLDEQTFELVEHNCPILAIAKEFKTACHCETAMFKQVIGTENVKRVSCKTEGDDHCKFLFALKEALPHSG